MNSRDDKGRDDDSRYGERIDGDSLFGGVL